MKRQFHKFGTSARIAVLAIMGVSVALGTPVANGLGSAKLTLVADRNLCWKTGGPTTVSD